MLETILDDFQQSEKINSVSKTLGAYSTAENEQTTRSNSDTIFAKGRIINHGQPEPRRVLKCCFSHFFPSIFNDFDLLFLNVFCFISV